MKLPPHRQALTMLILTTIGKSERKTTHGYLSMETSRAEISVT